MQVILQGSLRHFGAAELLTFLCGRDQNGTLDLEAAGQRARVLFQGRTIVWAESKRTRNAVDGAIDVLSWSDGSFTLLDSYALPDQATPLSMSLESLLEEAKRRAEAGGYHDGLLFRVVQDPPLQQVSLSGDEFKILFRLGTGRTLGELVADPGVARAELIEKLHKLEDLGLVRTGESEESAAPVQAPPPPPRGEDERAPAADTPPPRASAPPAESAERVQEKRSPTREKRNTMVGSLTPDEDPSSVHPLLDEVISIGRTDDNIIVINNGSVSSHHARIRRSSEGFTIEDLKSRNGTFVNSDKVDKPRVLADGDLVRIGKVLMTFNVATESVTPGATIAGDTPIT